eukprot:TRINITY_DN24098_c0_g1_i1.p1 TRINITY_DN24098_c0_g1~~TRINITY_DN24098_c0_g1_i1.p1  ORF type:complete len:442 (+),score=50.36 TRINITY_DN24098_c0_g1_i1:115-1440(+)
MPQMVAMSGCKSAPKYSFRGRPSTSPKPASPGPGAYTSTDVHERNKYQATPAYGFGSQRRDGYGNATTPGPGQYSPREWSDRELQQRQGFGGAGRRPASPRLETPGPAAYNTSPRVGEGGPKLSMGLKLDLQGALVSPGPAAYSTVDIASTAKMSKQPQHSFSRSVRDVRTSTAQPGPGQYNPKKLELGPKSAEFSFGNSGRKDLSPRTEPGPGSYNIDAMNDQKAPKFPLASRTRQTQSAILPTPGPGTYHGETVTSDHKFEDSPKFSFGGSPRDLPNGMTSPGPGQYSPSGAVQKPAAATHVFGTAVRSPASKPGSPRADMLSPGPGAYNMSPRLGNEGPKYSAAGRQDIKSCMETPGPGSYQVVEPAQANSLMSPRYKFGRSIRSVQRTMSTPGPGTYDSRRVSDPASPQLSFGMRLKLKQDHGTPGPGTHDHPTLFS